MSCNAWNHSANCNCGWGGDTGGGWTSPYSSGFWWKERTLTHASFVNPNAYCPVCGAAVYFYSSPSGGRVFFDSLGPPWPKHPCTDGGTIANRPRNAALPLNASSSNADQGWRPLLISDEHLQMPNVRLQIRQDNKLPGSFIYIPAAYRDLGPIFFKKSVEEPTEVMLSVWDEGAGIERCLSRSAWYASEDQRQAHTLKNIGPSADTLNQIGWSWSFAHQDDAKADWTSASDVDFAIARRFFTLGARTGSWIACNNLAVMMLRGYGRLPSPVFAVKMLNRANRLSSGRASLPLKHLSACYRMGIGVPINLEEASRLEKLARIAEEAGRPS